MKLSLYEQETIINFNEEEKTASVYTHSKALIRKLERLTQERPEDCKLDRVSREGKAATFTIPKAWVKIKPPRTLTEAQKEQLRKASENTRFA